MEECKNDFEAQEVESVEEGSLRILTAEIKATSNESEIIAAQLRGTPSQLRGTPTETDWRLADFLNENESSDDDSDSNVCPAR